MQILQLDVNKIEYEPIEPEAKFYEESEKKKTLVNDALVLLVSIEKDDTKKIAEQAIADAKKFMAQLKREKLVVYPFAHLSKNLEEPSKAMQILKYMRKSAKANGIDLAAEPPFGWNKRLSIDTKAHPLAEHAMSYGKALEAMQNVPKKERKIDVSIVKKSDWSGLPAEDHRTIGERMDLYSFQEISPAMVYWHPNGHTMYRELLKLMREKINEYNYQEISTPALANLALWKVSGHLEHYKEDMFIMEDDLGSLGLKPMNCPSSIMIYKSKKWSYRELPFRTAIFDRLYRSERSGVVTGLFRVKELTQDDGHIFLREDQLDKEVVDFLRLVKEVYDIFGMKFVANLSTMPEDHMGSQELWDKATLTLRQALDKNKLQYNLKEGDGAFYGPKIDFDVFDSIGRKWQCATLQLDYQVPLRFELEYTGEDGKAHTPIMLHRAVLGSLERFLGVLVEHYKGKFPTWLAPIQVRVLSLSDQNNEYAEEVAAALRKAKLRVELDISDKTLQYKIRDAKMQEVPYMVIVGKKEAEAKTISVRSRSNKSTFGLKVDDLASKLRAEVDSRSAEQSY